MYQHGGKIYQIATIICVPDGHKIYQIIFGANYHCYFLSLLFYHYNFIIIILSLLFLATNRQFPETNGALLLSVA
jgi:hypothetical protein